MSAFTEYFEGQLEALWDSIKQEDDNTSYKSIVSSVSDVYFQSNLDYLTFRKLFEELYLYEYGSYQFSFINLIIILNLHYLRKFEEEDNYQEHVEFIDLLLKKYNQQRFMENKGFKPKMFRFLFNEFDFQEKFEQLQTYDERSTLINEMKIHFNEAYKRSGDSINEVKSFRDFLIKLEKENKLTHNGKVPRQVVNINQGGSSVTDISEISSNNSSRIKINNEKQREIIKSKLIEYINSDLEKVYLDGLLSGTNIPVVIRVNKPASTIIDYLLFNRDHFSIASDKEFEEWISQNFQYWDNKLKKYNNIKLRNIKMYSSENRVTPKKNRIR